MERDPSRHGASPCRVRELMLMDSAAVVGGGIDHDAHSSGIGSFDTIKMMSSRSVPLRVLVRTRVGIVLARGNRVGRSVMAAVSGTMASPRRRSGPARSSF